MRVGCVTKKNENSLSKTDMVTIDDLKLINPVYDRRYVVSVTDVAKANRLIEDIERNLHTGVPQVGDLVCGSYYRGSQTFERGIIDRRYREAPDVVSVCYHPYVPFVEGDDDEVVLSVSGGPFTAAYQSMFECIGEEERLFCDFGHCGPCEGGAFYFKARVKKWRLKGFDANYPWSSSGKNGYCEIDNPNLVHSAEYANWHEKGDLFNIYFGDEKKVKACAVYDGVSVGTSIQRLEYYLERHRGKLRPQLLALKCVVGEWVDVKASTAFQSENEMNHQRYAVITMATDTMTDEPSLCLQLHDGEFIYVNDYIGLRKVCTAFDHIAMK
jgi:hypothetical protein